VFPVGEGGVDTAGEEFEVGIGGAGRQVRVSGCGSAGAGVAAGSAGALFQFRVLLVAGRVADILFCKILFQGRGEVDACLVGDTDKDP